MPGDAQEPGREPAILSPERPVSSHLYSCLALLLPAQRLDSKLSSMGAPKRKHGEQLPTPREPTEAEREAAEMRADVEDYDKAKAEWEAAGRPPGIPWEEAKRKLGLK
jgi:hypothetical protein